MTTQHNARITTINHLDERMCCRIHNAKQNMNNSNIRMLNQNGVLPTVSQVLMVPTTLGELNGMTVAELDSLLQFYAIPLSDHLNVFA